MSNGFSNQPKILRGAFVEYGLSLPPLIVCFQFNPETISRSRSLYISVPRGAQPERGWLSLREYQQREEFINLIKLREAQDVSVQSESVSFELRLDATDKLNDGNPIAQQFGIAPELSTLELMMYPKGESILGELVSGLIEGYSFTGKEKPPIVLFVWGRKRILPINITSMSITEQEFSTDLNPIRATISVSMRVIEGENAPYKYSKAMKEAMSVLNLANLPEVANVIIPI
ncbi:MAG: hypothetical protein ACFFCW_01415 [Candidatus Hodarchaeota archaeon]